MHSYIYQKHVDILLQDKLISRGHRNQSNKIWYFNLNQEENNNNSTANNAMSYIIPKTKSEKLTRFLHGYCGSTPKKSFEYAVKKNV